MAVSELSEPPFVRSDLLANHANHAKGRGSRTGLDLKRNSRRFASFAGSRREVEGYGLRVES